MWWSHSLMSEERRRRREEGGGGTKEGGDKGRVIIFLLYDLSTHHPTLVTPYTYHSDNDLSAPCLPVVHPPRSHTKRPSTPLQNEVYHPPPVSITVCHCHHSNHRVNTSILRNQETVRTLWKRRCGRGVAGGVAGVWQICLI